MRCGGTVHMRYIMRHVRAKDHKRENATFMSSNGEIKVMSGYRFWAWILIEFSTKRSDPIGDWRT